MEKSVLAGLLAGGADGDLDLEGVRDPERAAERDLPLGDLERVLPRGVLAGDGERVLPRGVLAGDGDRDLDLDPDGVLENERLGVLERDLLGAGIFGIR